MQRVLLLTFVPFPILKIKAMKKKLSVLFCIFSLISVAQISTIDSLNAEFKKHPDNIKLELEIGVYHFKKGDYEKSLRALNDVAVKASIQKNDELLLKAFTNIGNVCVDKGETTKAMENYQKALKIAESSSNKKNIASLLKNIGILYVTWKIFPKALEYYQKAESIAIEIRDSSLIADCHNNKGVVYEQQQKYDEALSEYKEALNYYLKNNPENITMEYTNMAIVYKLKKDYASSVKYNLSAIDLAIKSGDKWLAAAIYNNIGNLYVELGDTKKAIDYCNKSLAIAKEINATEVLINVYETLADAKAKAGDYKSAFDNQKQFATIKDKFISTENTKQLNELQTKYETEKKDNEIKTLQGEKTISNLKISEQNLILQKRNYLLALVLLILIVLLSGSYFYYSRLKLKNRIAKEKAIKETEEHERMRIAKDIHDDLGSGLSKINFLSEIIYSKTELLPEIRHSSESVKETAKRMIDNMRDLIWALNPDNTTLPNLIARMREYTTDYLEDFPIEIKYSFPDNIPQISINKESHRELFMIVKETLNNISKHSKATEILFNVVLTDTDFSFSIRDNGTGFNEETIKRGNGLRNMNSRITVLGGVFEVKSELNKYTLISVSIPLQKIIKS